MVWNGQVVHYSLTDVGIKRSHNQDAFGISAAHSQDVFESRGHLFLVADGMGAHAVGELASKMAVDTIPHNYAKTRGLEPIAALRQAVVEANQAIYERGTQNPGFQGMGTTTTALLLLPEGAHVAHVGDSRCYRLRGPRVEQLSYDHSLQWEIARRQHVAPEELTSVPSNIIVRSLGPEARVEVDTSGPYDIQEGDKFLLCSDGLTGRVADRELGAVINHLPGQEACQFLVDLANLRGGIDNITIILVEIGDPDNRGPFKPVVADTRFNGKRLWKAARRKLEDLRRWYRQRGQEPEPPPPPPPVYRVCDCSLQPRLIENLAKAERNLREMGVEESWQVNWTLLHDTRGKAEEHAREGRLSEAFREFCRAISVLSVGQSKHRDKQEVLLPNWDTKER